MPLFALLAAATAVGLDQLVQGQFGIMGLIGLGLLTAGVKAKNLACASFGAVVLVVLVQPLIA
ncbi:hypothetical protein [Streptomyces sp. NPDC050738]|uniref:hypothetical protein n=1 Tax=Streptomyces sp. NPDC050738 TaxID=3154744 RepID=UPI00343B8503